MPPWSGSATWTDLTGNGPPLTDPPQLAPHGGAPPPPVPEPSTAVLLGAGLVGAAALRRVRRARDG